MSFNRLYFPFFILFDQVSCTTSEHHYSTVILKYLKMVALSIGIAFQATKQAAIEKQANIKCDVSHCS